uniref:Uncharacterized protein n=1 Tax=Latimeria chalumnae TaxID=7897 RepID=H3AAN9_LATCH
MVPLKPPGPLIFEGNVSENWKCWLQRFNIFVCASGLSQKPDKFKASALLHIAGDKPKMLNVEHVISLIILLKLVALNKTKTKILAYSGHKINSCGRATLACQYKEKYKLIDFEILDQNVPSVLGLSTCVELNLLKRIHTVQQLKETVLQGWPRERSTVPLGARPYWCYRDEISVYDDILFKGDRVIIPSSM